MTHPVLSRGDKGDTVRQLQSLLNRVGGMLLADGDFGAGTQRAVRYAQDLAAQPVTGTADAVLWPWLDQRPDPFPLLATNGVAMIAREETGGLALYEALSQWPQYPGVDSGITIGVGYDLRFNSEADLRALWGPHLPANALEELAGDIGKRGSKRRAAELRKMGIAVPFKAAWPVFVEKTVPRYYQETVAIYPSLPRLPSLCRSVLVSIVFNRGPSLKGGTRTEMRTIQEMLVEADSPGMDQGQRKRLLTGVEDQILSMRRLWPVGSGLQKRRQTEANFWREGISES
ncbi:MAG: peptidoglycan-binding protein [Arenicellales bacterium]